MYSCYQISGNRGPDLWLVVEANTKDLLPKPSRSRVIKLMDRGRVEANIEAESAIFLVIHKFLQQIPGQYLATRQTEPSA